MKISNSVLRLQYNLKLFPLLKYDPTNLVRMKGVEEKGPLVYKNCRKEIKVTNYLLVL